MLASSFGMRVVLFADGDFDTAVLGAAFGSGIAFGRFGLALADSGNAVGGNAFFNEHLLDLSGNFLIHLSISSTSLFLN